MDQEQTFNLAEFLKTLTTHPGIYQMLGEEGEVLYVGKARNLKKRVNSYFLRSKKDSKTVALVKQIKRIEVIITNSEVEALLLENNLIKKHQPHYNILLRDDKSYPYIFISDHADYPRLDFHRGSKYGKGRYFGPYPSAGAVRDSIHLLQKIFRLRQCDDTFFQNRTRPCLQYQIKRCSAPCVQHIQPAAYQQDVKHAMLFLEGKNVEVIHDLVARMEGASTELQFEQAAKYRDQIAKLRRLQHQQYVSRDEGDVDVIAAAEQNGQFCVQVLFIRTGRLLGNKAYFPQAPGNTSINEMLEGFLTQFYLQAERLKALPAIVIINQTVPTTQWLATALTEQTRQRIQFLRQVRGERAKFLEIAEKNAQMALANHVSSKATLYRRYEALKEVLNLENLPQRLECFDISHTQGEATIGACVVFNLEGPLKSDYRRYPIKDITKNDDYAAIRQAVQLRYQKVKEQDGKLPDVIIIDGGKGQLRQAEEVLHELQVSGVTVLAIAKGLARKPGLETLILADSHKTLILPPDSLALHLIQQIRDEAHRFAITGHRQARGKARITSTLQNIPGIGAKRRQQLLKHFGGLQELKRVSAAEIAKVPGVSKELAERIYAALR